MIKLYQINTKSNQKYFCFAHDKRSARQIVQKEYSLLQSEILETTDITQKKINQDGVKFLIENNFVGIPKKKMFMLHGSMSAINSHYKTQNRTAELWYSPAVPGSEELWK